MNKKIFTLIASIISIFYTYTAQEAQITYNWRPFLINKSACQMNSYQEILIPPYAIENISCELGFQLNNTYAYSLKIGQEREDINIFNPYFCTHHFPFSPALQSQKTYPNRPWQPCFIYTPSSFSAGSYPILVIKGKSFLDLDEYTLDHINIHYPMLLKPNFSAENQHNEHMQTKIAGQLARINAHWEAEQKRLKNRAPLNEPTSLTSTKDVNRHFTNPVPFLYCTPTEQNFTQDTESSNSFVPDSEHDSGNEEDNVTPASSTYSRGTDPIGQRQSVSTATQTLLSIASSDFSSLTPQAPTKKNKKKKSSKPTQAAIEKEARRREEQRKQDILKSTFSKIAKQAAEKACTIAQIKKNENTQEAKVKRTLKTVEKQDTLSLLAKPTKPDDANLLHKAIKQSKKEAKDLAQQAQVKSTLSCTPQNPPRISLQLDPKAAFKEKIVITTITEKVASCNEHLTLSETQNLIDLLLKHKDCRIPQNLLLDTTDETLTQIEKYKTAAKKIVETSLEYRLIEPDIVTSQDFLNFIYDNNTTAINIQTTKVAWQVADDKEKLTSHLNEMYKFITSSTKKEKNTKKYNTILASLCKRYRTEVIEVLEIIYRNNSPLFKLADIDITSIVNAALFCFDLTDSIDAFKGLMKYKHVITDTQWETFWARMCLKYKPEYKEFFNLINTACLEAIVEFYLKNPQPQYIALITRMAHSTYDIIEYKSFLIAYTIQKIAYTPQHKNLLNSICNKSITKDSKEYLELRNILDFLNTIDSNQETMSFCIKMKTNKIFVETALKLIDNQCSNNQQELISSELLSLIDQSSSHLHPYIQDTHAHILDLFSKYFSTNEESATENLCTYFSDLD